MMALLTGNDISVYVEGLDHPEGVAWGPDGYIYAGGEAGQLYRIDPRNPGPDIIAHTGGFILGLALDKNSNIYACDSLHAVVQIISPEGRVAAYCNGAADEPFVMPNYPVFDRQGNLYVSDSGKWKQNNGKIIKIKPGGRGEVWSRAITDFTNGLCLNADETYLYAATSRSPGVYRIELKDDGSSGDVETVVKLPGTVPDGLAFDADANLYISCYRPDAIYRYTTEAKLEVVAEDPEGTAMAAPTNIAFCGDKLDMLLSANLGRWHLSRYNLKTSGQALNYPDFD